MSQIARNIEGLIGNTPLVELSKTEKALKLKGRVLAKLEFNNPGRSVKDRVALALIEQAEKWSATDIRAKAIEMLGASGYLRRKIEKGYDLWVVDRELLMALL
jgi:cysteine synthase